MLAENVVKFQNENMVIYEHVQSWFKDLNKKNRDFEEYDQTTGTAATYEEGIRMFFRLMRGQKKGEELEYLSKEDIQITLEDIEGYINLLCDSEDNTGKNKYTNKTINKKVAALKSFIKYMTKKKIINELPKLELIESLKERENHWGILSVNEVFKMADLCLEEKNDREMKRLAILFSLDTCVRISALLKIKWQHFMMKEDGVLVEWIDKGNKEFRKMISKEFYEDLLTIKGESEYVFYNLSNKNLSNLMIRLLKKLKIEEQRNIVWHSIRKCGGTFAFRISGSIVQAQKALGHAQLNTTMIYVDTEDLQAVGAVSSIGKINNNLYKETDHSVLLEAIKQMPKDYQLMLNMKINGVLENK